MTLPNEADIKCPKCADIMIITKIEGIEVEKCIGCKGIFLDGGEIDKIRERIRQRGEDGVWGIGFIKNLSTF
jgi:Zn-finger nucleic acid-binding protein